MHFKTEILLQNMQIYASLYHKCNFPPSSRVSLQECWEKYFNATSPLPFGHSPIAQTCVISLQDLTSFARGEVGTRIDRDISLLMPLRLRGGFATECHAFSY